MMKSFAHKCLTLQYTWLRVAVFCATVFFTFCLIFYHTYLITNPFPLEYREAVMPTSTQLLLDGENPYDLKHQPAYTNSYGILFPLMMWPGAKLFGPSLQLFRAGSAFFIFLSCFLVWAVFWKKSIPSRLSVPGTLLLYGALLYYTNPAAKPDSLGLFLFLCAILIPYLYDYSPFSLSISPFFATAAFFTKPYFGLAMPYMAVYLFFFVSRKEGIFYFFSCFIYMSLAAIGTILFTECYFQNTLFSQLIMSKIGDAGTEYSLMQFLAFIRVFKGLFLLLIAVCLVNFFKLFKGRHETASEDRLGISAFCFIVSCLIVYFIFGRHSGAWMLYLFQLILPFFVIMVIDHASRARIAPLILVGALLCDLSYMSFHLLRVQNYKQISGDTQSWGRVERLIESHDNIYHSPLVAPLILKHKKPVYESGHSDQFVFGAKFPGLSIGETTYLESTYDEKITERFKAFQDSLNSAITNKGFDLIILDDRARIAASRELIDENYRIEKRMTLDIKKTGNIFRVTVWAPAGN